MSSSGSESGADDRALGQAKKTLRAAVRRRRDVRPHADRERDDDARAAVIMERLSAGPSPAEVACYLSSAPEPGTLRLIGWLAARQIRVLLPVLRETDDGTLSDPEWAAYEGPDELVEGPRGIVQPSGPALGPRTLAGAELIMIPGLAANRAGDRLGRGGGWYDRALAHAEPSARVSVLLNDDEVLSVIPVQDWDRPVGAIVTPGGWIDCRA